MSWSGDTGSCYMAVVTKLKGRTALRTRHRIDCISSLACFLFWFARRRERNIQHQCPGRALTFEHYLESIINFTVSSTGVRDVRGSLLAVGQVVPGESAASGGYGTDGVPM